MVGKLFGFVTVEAFKYSLNASESLSIRQARPFHGIDWNPFSSVDRCIISTQSLYWSTAGIGWRLVALLSKPRYEQFPNVYCCLCFSSMFIPQGLSLLYASFKSSVRSTVGEKLVINSPAVWPRLVASWSLSPCSLSPCPLSLELTISASWNAELWGKFDGLVLIW